MRQLNGRTGAVAMFLLFSLAACGTTVRPRASTGGGERLPGYPADDALGRRPGTAVAGATDGRDMIDQVCRARAVPAGWVVVRYVDGGDACPPARESEQPYNAAVIERFSQRPAGSSMVVCADQAVPRDWVREWSRDAGAECAGARVSADAPTAMVIRRVR